MTHTNASAANICQRYIENLIRVPILVLGQRSSNSSLNVKYFAQILHFTLNFETWQDVSIRSKQTAFHFKRKKSQSLDSLKVIAEMLAWMGGTRKKIQDAKRLKAPCAPRRNDTARLLNSQASHVYQIITTAFVTLTVSANKLAPCRKLSLSSNYKKLQENSQREQYFSSWNWL